MTDPGDQILLLVNEGGHQLGGIYLTGTHSHKLLALKVKIFLHQFLGIVDDPHSGNGIKPQMGADQQRLRIGVADTADTGASPEAGQVLFKLGPKGCILDVVDLPLKAPVPVIEDQSPPAGTQVGMVIHAEKYVKYAVPFGDGPKKSSHGLTPFPSGGSGPPDRPPSLPPDPGGTGLCPDGRRSAYPRAGRCRG